MRGKCGPSYIFLASYSILKRKRYLSGSPGLIPTGITGEVWTYCDEKILSGAMKGLSATKTGWIAAIFTSK